MSRQPSRRRSYANINMRFARRPCAYRNRVTRPKQFAFAMCKRARAWLRCRVTRSSRALMPMASARCTPHFRSNNSSRVRKSFGALTALPGHGASINVAPSIHLTPRKRSVSATYYELKNGLRWVAIATPPTCKTGYWSGATPKDFNEASVFMVKALGLDQSPVKWCQAPKP